MILNKLGYVECDHCNQRFPGISAKYYWLRIDKYGLLATCTLCAPSLNSPWHKYQEINKEEYIKRSKLELFR